MGDLVTLRPVTEDDLAWLASLRNSPAASGLHEWHGWTDPQRRRRKWAESGLLGDDGGTLIVLHDTDRVGHVSWRRVKTGPTAFGWAIAVGLAPDFRGRGYGSEAQRLLARYLFAHTQVNRIEATTEITNVAEQRALEKAGFTREGILRGTTFRQGRWHDHVIYSVLRDEVNLMDASAEDGAGALAEGTAGTNGLGEANAAIRSARSPSYAQRGDLSIVVGRSGHATRHVLGSVPVRLLHHSPYPVLAVP